MLSPTAAYRMSKSGKIALMSADKSRRSSIRKSIIIAELYNRIVVTRKHRDKE